MLIRRPLFGRQRQRKVLKLRQLANLGRLGRLLRALESRLALAGQLGRRRFKISVAAAGASKVEWPSRKHFRSLNRPACNELFARQARAGKLAAAPK